MNDRKNYIRLDGEIIARNIKTDCYKLYFEDGYAIPVQHNAACNYWCVYNFAGDLLIYRNFGQFKNAVYIQSNRDYLIMVEMTTVCVYSRHLLKPITMFEPRRLANDPPSPIFRINVNKVLPHMIYSMDVALVDDYFYVIVTATDDQTIILKYTYAGELVEMNTIGGNYWCVMNSCDTVILHDKISSDDNTITCEIRNIESSEHNGYFYNIKPRKNHSILSQFYPGIVNNLQLDESHRNDYILVKKQSDATLKDGKTSKEIKPYFPKLLVDCDIVYISNRMIYTAHAKDSVIKRYILPEECFGEI